MGSVSHLRCPITIHSHLRLWRAPSLSLRVAICNTGVLLLQLVRIMRETVGRGHLKRRQSPGRPAAFRPGARRNSEQASSCRAAFPRKEARDPTSGAGTHPGTQGTCVLPRGPARPARGRKPQPSPRTPGIHVSFFAASNTAPLSGPSSGKAKGTPS